MGLVIQIGFHGHFQIADDDHQQIIEFMSDAAGQLSNGFHLLSLTELLVPFVMFRHVEDKVEKAYDVAPLHPCGAR